MVYMAWFMVLIHFHIIINYEIAYNIAIAECPLFLCHILLKMHRTISLCNK